MIFQIQNQTTLLDTQLAAASRLNFLLRWIGASALIVPALGTLDINWIAVKERTREFGTRRALGASDADFFCKSLPKVRSSLWLGASQVFHSLGR